MMWLKVKSLRLKVDDGRLKEAKVERKRRGSEGDRSQKVSEGQ